MVWMCTEMRDFSPLLPLSWKDHIYLRECLFAQKEHERDFNALQADVRFLLGVIASYLTGAEDWTNLPSEILRRTRFYEQRKSGDGSQS